MAIIVNNPPANTNEGNNNGMLLGVILLAIILFIFLYLGLPLLRGAASTSGTQVNVPDHMNVKVQQTK
jgi:hypothetical protein